MQHKFATLIFIIVSFCQPSSTFASQLPDLGNEFRSVLSVRDERILGDHFMRELRSTGMLSSDQILQEYLRYVGHRLTPHMPIPYSHLQPKFFVLNDKTVNAFAFFGGHVAVHTGLIALTESENELAGVMAHELAHIAQEHLIRGIAESKRTLPIALAGSIAAGLLAGPEMILPVLAGHMQHMVNFTRQHEAEADRIGMQILAKAKFDPQGLPSIFERMSANSRYEGRLPEYLSTHPLYESRISDTRHRASTLPYTRKPDSEMYQLIKARVEVQRSDNHQQLVYDLQHQLKTKRYANELRTKYCHAYALQYAGKNKEAYAAIKDVLKIAPDNMIVQITAAEIEANNEMFKEAQMRLEEQLSLNYDSPSLKLHYIKLLISTSQAPQACRALDEFEQLHPTDLLFYELRRQAEGMLNNKSGVYQANAEWYFLIGNYSASLAQLQYALELPETTAANNTKIKQRQKEIITNAQQLSSL